MAIAYEQASKTAVARPPYPAYPTITSAFMQAVDQAFNGGDPKAALTRSRRRSTRTSRITTDIRPSVIN